MKKFYLVVVAAVIVFIVTVVGYAIYDGKFTTKTETYAYNNVLNQEISDSFNFIEISTSSADITFEKSDISKVVVDGTTSSASVEVVNGVLSIKYDNSDCSIMCSGDIKVYMPDTVKAITINSRNSDIHAFDLPNTTFNMTMNNGDLKFGKIESLSLTSNNGDISIDEVTNKVDIVTNNGNVKIDKVSLQENSNIKTNMGDIKINSIRNVNVFGNTSLGETTINNNAESDIKLTLKTNVGDIEVNK